MTKLKLVLKQKSGQANQQLKQEAFATEALYWWRVHQHGLDLHIDHRDDQVKVLNVGLINEVAIPTLTTIEANYRKWRPMHKLI